MARSHAGHTSLPAGDPDTWLMHVMSATLVVAVLLVVAWWVLRDALAQRREAASKATYSVAGTVRRAGGLGALALLVWFVFPLPSWLVWAVPVLGTLVSEVELVRCAAAVITTCGPVLTLAAWASRMLGSKWSHCRPTARQLL